jgi:hypothetical protein
MHNLNWGIELLLTIAQNILNLIFDFFGAYILNYVNITSIECIIIIKILKNSIYNYSKKNLYHKPHYKCEYDFPTHKSNVPLVCLKHII